MSIRIRIPKSRLSKLMTITRKRDLWPAIAGRYSFVLFIRICFKTLWLQDRHETYEEVFVGLSMTLVTCYTYSEALL